MNLEEAFAFDIIEILHETAKAWEVKLKSGVYWLPKSQCRIVNKKIYIPGWLVEAKEI